MSDSAGSIFVSGIILAAGRSRRMGRSKQLLTYKGLPLLQHVVNTAVESDLDEVIVVLGNQADRVEALLVPGRARFVFNPDFASGQASSLHVGLQNRSSSSTASLVLLGDQPEVTRVTIDRLIEVFRREEPAIVLPSYQGRRGNPVLFSNALVPEVLKIRGDEGARSVVGQHPTDVELVHIDSDVPFDIDSPEDYAAVLRGERPG